MDDQFGFGLVVLLFSTFFDLTVTSPASSIKFSLSSTNIFFTLRKVLQFHYLLHARYGCQEEVGEHCGSVVGWSCFSGYFLWPLKWLALQE